MPRRRWRIALAAALLASGLGACANRALPPPPAPALAAPAERPLYRLDIGDVLDIRFALNPELNEQAVVGPDGRISVQYAHDVMAAGRTLDAITRDLDLAYAKELVNPRASVSLRSYAGTRVYVAGEVAAPGEFVETGPITALQAIARAGGFKTTAARSEVILIRRGADGKPDLFGLDEEGFTEGHPEHARDADLVNYDIVYVPRSPAGNVAYMFDQLRNILPFTFTTVYSIPP
jgi:protein involved in polysaccharide export with SLBB domain